MVGRQGRFEEIRVFRRVVPAMVLLAASAPPVAYAQVNIDQSKTPAQIYSSDCAVCHKSMHGLANGRGKSSLTGFLSEHYTSNGQEAAALAAYVLAGGGGVGTPAPPRTQPTLPERAEAPAEEPKTRGAGRPAKPGEAPAVNGKPQRPAGAGGKPEREERSATAAPNSPGAERKPPLASERHEPGAAARTQGRPKPTAAVPPKHAPARVVTAPKLAETPKPDTARAAPDQNAAGAIEAPPSDAVPAPTDNIPD
jgi:hypothetical protein